MDKAKEECPICGTKIVPPLPIVCNTCSHGASIDTCKHPEKGRTIKVGTYYGHLVYCPYYLHKDQL